MEKNDYLIIGGGMVGLNIANLLATNFPEKKGTIILRQGSHCASTSNQTWLQKGTLYLTGSNIPHVAKLLAFHSGILADRFNADLGEFGVFYFKEKADAQHAIDFNKKYNGFEGRFLKIEEAYDILGDEFFIEDKGYFITVPDCPFGEERILNQCLHNINAQGIEVIYSHDDVVLKKSLKQPNTFTVNVNNREIISEKTFIAAGLGTKQLLKNLDLHSNIPIVAYKSLLLNAPANIFSANPALFADRENQLSIVRQKKADGASVFLLGNSVRTNAKINFNEQEFSKSLTFEEMDSFFYGFKSYPLLMDKIREFSYNPNCYSVCFKVEQYDSRNPTQINYEPLVLSFDDQYAGLYVAISGKASLALYTAEKTLALAKMLGAHSEQKNIYSTDLNRILKLWYDNENNY